MGSQKQKVGDVVVCVPQVAVVVAGGLSFLGLQDQVAGYLYGVQKLQSK